MLLLSEARSRGGQFRVPPSAVRLKPSRCSYSPLPVQTLPPTSIETPRVAQSYERRGVDVAAAAAGHPKFVRDEWLNASLLRSAEYRLRRSWKRCERDCSKGRLPSRLCKSLSLGDGRWRVSVRYGFVTEAEKRPAADTLEVPDLLPPLPGADVTQRGVLLTVAENKRPSLRNQKARDDNHDLKNATTNDKHNREGKGWT